MLTGTEHIERMENLLRRMAKLHMTTLLENTLIAAPQSDYLEARDIVAKIDGPKTDAEWARKVWLDGGGMIDAIAKGRELERNK